MNVKGFNVTQGLIHDPMHVLFEGLTHLTVKQLLKHLLCNLKIVSVSAFNKRLQDFSQTLRADCRPNPIDENQLNTETKLKQTAHLIWWLSNILPFIIGDAVPSGDAKYVTFLRLLQIQQLCTSAVATALTIRSLEIIVTRFITSFLASYPELGFTPKLHYLVHFPRQIMLYGPSRNHWCMRMEAKNGFLKRKKLRNTQNVPLSVARALDLFQAA